MDGDDEIVLVNVRVEPFSVILLVFPIGALVTVIVAVITSAAWIQQRLRRRAMVTTALMIAGLPPVFRCWSAECMPSAYRPLTAK